MVATAAITIAEVIAAAIAVTIAVTVPDTAAATAAVATATIVTVTITTTNTTTIAKEPPGVLAANKKGEKLKMFYHSYVGFSKKENPDSQGFFTGSNVGGPPTYLAGKVIKFYYDFYSPKHVPVDRVKSFAWRERYDFSFSYNFAFCLWTRP
jgi:hypothetical protein